MLALLKRVFLSRSHPLNKILISRNHLINNYKYLTSINSKIKIAPVLKSNAYGHGIELVGKILDSRFRGNDREKSPFICVDSLYEAYQLHKTGVKTQILIMGYIDPISLSRKTLPFSYAIWDLNLARAIDKYQKGAEVHVFVDTGMNREGIPIKCKVQSEKCKVGENNCLLHFIAELKMLKNLKITGVMTHLAMADKPKDPLTIKQLKNFKKAQEIFKEQKVQTKWQHIGGGVSILAIKNPPCNLIRVGKVLYGVGARHPEPFGSEPQGRRLVSGSGSRNKFGMTLKPILKLITKIAQIKQISRGDRIGYDGTFSAKKEMGIGILPIGYNDGVDRRLSNKGFVLIDNKPCKILGRVSMNLTTIDLSKVKNPKVGDEVVVFSNNPSDPNSIENAAKTCKTIPYDLMIHLNPSTKRVVV